MGRQPCCEKVGLKRGPWTIEEDQKLMNFILNNGIQCWRLVPRLAGLLRCGKSCRLRWINYLRPDLKRGALTEAEEDQIIQLHSRFGNRWSTIASHFPGRTDNEIKNHWNTRIKKKMRLVGLDPQTHKPVEHPENCSETQKVLEPENESLSEHLTGANNLLNGETSSGMNQISSYITGTPISGFANDIVANEIHDSIGYTRTNVKSETQSSDALSMRMDESSTSGVFQNWIDSADSQLSWDLWNDLESIFH